MSGPDAKDAAPPLVEVTGIAKHYGGVVAIEERHRRGGTVWGTVGGDRRAEGTLQGSPNTTANTLATLTPS